MLTYLEQIQSCAQRNGVDLKAACRAEGIALTTLMRWEKGEAFPREGTARALIQRIEAMGTLSATHGAAAEGEAA